MDLVSTSVQTSNRILGICKAYIKGVKDAPADLRHILIEVGSLKCVLEVLQLSAEASDGALLRHLNGPNGPLERCRETLVDLEAILVTNGGPSSGNENEAGAGSFDGKASSFFKKGKTGSTQDAHVGSSGVSYQDLQWPFKRTLALRLLAELTTYKQTISLGLTTETWQDVKQLKQKVDHLQVMTEGAEMNQILTWLVTIDPSPLHNSACDLHEPHTGQWLIRSPDYTRWKQLQATFIWLHGIPGAGKTVLLSYIAEDVRAFCGDKTNVGYGWAYYYCSFTHNGEESPHFLRWIINQLCRQIGRFPLELQKLFRRGEQPSVLVLFQALMAVTRCFERVYIVVDAVDESQEREKLIELLLKLAREPSLGRLQLLVMSRKERNIAEAFLSESTDISLSNPYVDEDIKTFVHGQLETDSKLSRWNLTLRDEIEEALVKGAQGMFRWVFCQLDILKRLNLATAIRQAIAKLPKTLDDTYERVLCSIPEEQCGNCHKALQLLAEGGSAIDTLWHINISAEMDFDNLKILEIDEPTRDVARRSSVAFRAINVSSDRFRRAARLSDAEFEITERAASLFKAKYYLLILLKLGLKRYDTFFQRNLASELTYAWSEIVSAEDRVALGQQLWNTLMKGPWLNRIESLPFFYSNQAVLNPENILNAIQETREQSRIMSSIAYSLDHIMTRSFLFRGGFGTVFSSYEGAAADAIAYQNSRMMSRGQCQNRRVSRLDRIANPSLLPRLDA